MLVCHKRGTIGKHCNTGRCVRDLCDDICAEARDAPRPVVILDLRGRTRFMDRTSCANLFQQGSAERQ